MKIANVRTITVDEINRNIIVSGEVGGEPKEADDDQKTMNES